MAEVLYNARVPHDFTIGDVIRKARTSRHWSQTKLGSEAARFVIDETEKRINKSTVSKVEKDPYSSELGTIWRLMATLGLKFTDVERKVSTPIVERAQAGEAPPPAIKRRRAGD